MNVTWIISIEKSSEEIMHFEEIMYSPKRALQCLMIPSNMGHYQYLIYEFLLYFLSRFCVGDFLG
jgi:hypothetical protein